MSEKSLLQKLSYHKTVISSLFDAPCAIKTVKLAALERKIVALEELVLELPIDDGSGRFEEWRNTVLALYHRLFLIPLREKKAKKVKSSKELAISKESSFTQKSSTSEEIETGTETSASAGEQASVDDRATQQNSLSSGGRPVKPVLEFAVKKQADETKKEKLRASIEAAFSKLDPVEAITVDSDLEGFRLYSLLVNRSIRQLSRFEDDAQLLSSVLGYALPKAPLTVIERFNSYNEAEEKEEGGESANPKRPPLKNLRLLKKCIVKELSSFYEDLKAALVSEDGSDSGVAVDGSQTCYICKSDEHCKAECPLVRVRVRFIFSSILNWPCFFLHSFR